MFTYADHFNIRFEEKKIFLYDICPCYVNKEYNYVGRIFKQKKKKV